MATIPLEDSFTDILGKAQRGQKLSDETLAQRTGISIEELHRIKGGEIHAPFLRKLAAALNLGVDAWIDSANKVWAPEPIEVAGLAQFTTAYEDMTVNSFLVWDPQTGDAAAFDTGADCEPMLLFAQENKLRIKLVLLTHTHPDHIADLQRLTAQTGATAWVGRREDFGGAQPFDEGRTFAVGGLKIETRQTSGHAPGGITFVIHGLARPVAVVGDAIFAGSMGGGLISFAGHWTTIGEKSSRCQTTRSSPRATGRSRPWPNRRHTILFTPNSNNP